MENKPGVKMIPKSILASVGIPMTALQNPVHSSSHQVVKALLKNRFSYLRMDPSLERDSIMALCAAAMVARGCGDVRFVDESSVLDLHSRTFRGSEEDLDEWSRLCSAGFLALDQVDGLHSHRNQPFSIPALLDSVVNGVEGRCCIASCLPKKDLIIFYGETARHALNYFVELEHCV